MEKLDILLVGCGVANLCLGNYLRKEGKKKFIIVDKGKGLDMRDHECERSCVDGVGGAGLFSDGKFSFFPSGTEIWKLDNIKESYEELRDIFDGILEIPDLPERLDYELDLGEEWKQKKYKSLYLSLRKRKELINKITPKDNLITETRVVEIKRNGGRYIVKCEGKVEKEYDVEKIVFGCGRFGPLQIGGIIEDIPMVFKRVELGVRVEGRSDDELYNKSEMIDPKFIREDSEAQYRTFCWCRDGEVKMTNFDGIKTYSGRSDISSTGKSNFGFNVRFKNKESMKYLYQALSSKQFETNKLEWQMGDVTVKIRAGIESFVGQKEYKFIGPTIEGVGYYPIIDSELKIPDEEIYVVGDMTGVFRGIIPSMLSGISVGIRLRPIVIALSGKRFSGKTTYGKMLSERYNFDLKSFSTYLKTLFCDKYHLHPDTLNSRDTKENLRHLILDFYHNECGHINFTKCLIDKISGNTVIDDVRFPEQIYELKKHFNVITVRINSNNRSLFGFTPSYVDLDISETALDDYKFDILLENDCTSSFFDFSKIDAILERSFKNQKIRKIK